MKNKSDQVVLDEFRKWVGDNQEAMKDQENRIAFGKEYCSSREWKFIWKVFDQEVSKNSYCLELFYLIILTERNTGRKIQKQNDPRDLRDLFHFCNPHQSLTRSRNRPPSRGTCTGDRCGKYFLILTILF